MLQTYIYSDSIFGSLKLNYKFKTRSDSLHLLKPKLFCVRKHLVRLILPGDLLTGDARLEFLRNSSPGQKCVRARDADGRDSRLSIFNGTSVFLLFVGLFAKLTRLYPSLACLTL